MLKMLSADAKRTLNQQHIPETPETFLAAVISQLNANSLMLLSCIFILGTVPIGVAEAREDLHACLKAGGNCERLSLLPAIGYILCMDYWEFA